VQLNWLGGGFSRYLVELGGWPGWHISGDWPSAGFQAYYPSARTRISPDVFLKQTAAAVQLVNVLMTKDVIALAPAWGYLQVAATTLEDSAFSEQARAAAGRATLKSDVDRVFDLVKSGRYAEIAGALASVSADAGKLLVAKDAERVNAAIVQSKAMAERGLGRQAKAL